MSLTSLYMLVDNAQYHLNHIRCHCLNRFTHVLLFCHWRFRKVSTSSHLPPVLLTLCDRVTNMLILLSLCADASIVWHITVRKGGGGKWITYFELRSVASNLLMVSVWLAVQTSRRSLGYIVYKHKCKYHLKGLFLRACDNFINEY